MDRIGQLQMERWRRGRHARGLSNSDPFQGDANRELVEELLDALNYLALVSIPEEAKAEINHLLRDALHIFWHATGEELGRYPEDDHRHP